MLKSVIMSLVSCFALVGCTDTMFVADNSMPPLPQGVIDTLADKSQGDTRQFTLHGDDRKFLCHYSNDDDCLRLKPGYMVEVVTYVVYKDSRDVVHVYSLDIR